MDLSLELQLRHTEMSNSIVTILRLIGIFKDMHRESFWFHDQETDELYIKIPSIDLQKILNGTKIEKLDSKFNDRR